MTDAKTTATMTSTTWQILGQSNHDLSRCSLCGALRIPLAESRFSVCTLIGCKEPAHDFNLEQRFADHDAALAAAVREQCAFAVHPEDFEAGTSENCALGGAQAEIRALPVCDADGYIERVRLEARLAEARWWNESGFDLTDYADQRYRKDRIAELEAELRRQGSEK